MIADGIDRHFHDAGLLCEAGWVDCEAKWVSAGFEEGVVRTAYGGMHEINHKIELAEGREGLCTLTRHANVLERALV